MKRLVGFLRTLWAREPVLVSTLIPLGVSVGLISQAQGSTLQDTITAIVAAVVQVCAALGIRSQVSPAAKPPAK